MLLAGITIWFVIGALREIWRSEGRPPPWLDRIVVVLCAHIVVFREVETQVCFALLLFLACKLRRYRARPAPRIPGCEIVRRPWTSFRS